MKKILALTLAALMAVAVMAGCSNQPNESTEPTSSFDEAKDISVCSREPGSGTRGAFVELMGIEQKNDAGEKVDRTIDTAAISNSTSVIMTAVAGDTYAIGYISLGSLSDTVKALKIDGVEATVDNIKNGTYKVARPFNIVTTGEVGEVAQDFINFIMSADGQQVIEDNHYISVSDAAAFEKSSISGKLVIAGSSSVTPVMEKLAEAYNTINPDVEIEVQQSDSTTGVTSAIDGVCDIGMASRELKDSEIEKGAVGTVIAMDGIAIVVNNDNPIEGLSSEQVCNIYIGDITAWNEVID